jgi:hypothetical protein
MLDTLISLKILLVLMIGILVLDEIFLSLQTAETANFFAGRAALVDEDVYRVDQFFNDNVFRYFIYTKNNPFVKIDELQTVRDTNTSHWITKLHIHSNLRSREVRSYQKHGYIESSAIHEIHR